MARRSGCGRARDDRAPLEELRAREPAARPPASAIRPRSIYTLVPARRRRHRRRRRAAGARRRIAAARARARRGLRGDAPRDPVLAAFGAVARERAHPARVSAPSSSPGMAMDVARHALRDASTICSLYAWRVAGVVGLMMSHVFGIARRRGAGPRRAPRHRDAAHEHLPRRRRGLRGAAASICPPSCSRARRAARARPRRSRDARSRSRASRPARARRSLLPLRRSRHRRAAVARGARGPRRAQRLRRDRSRIARIARRRCRPRRRVPRRRSSRSSAARSVAPCWPRRSTRARAATASPLASLELADVPRL